MSHQKTISKDLPEVSEKSKKNEILDAYYELLNQIKENKQESRQEEKRLNKKKYWSKALRE